MNTICYVSWATDTISTSESLRKSFVGPGFQALVLLSIANINFYWSPDLILATKSDIHKRIISELQPYTHFSHDSFHRTYVQIYQV